MTTTITEQPEIGAALSAYRLYATRLHADEAEVLTLECPHEHDHNQCPAGGCVANLLNDQERHRLSIRLGDLVRLAAMHDDPEPSIERTRRLGDLDRQLGELASYRVSAEDDEEPFLALNCPYRGGRCPGSEEGECRANLIPDGQAHIDLGDALQLAAAHEQARYGVPVARLAVLRRGWEIRQRAESYTRETADGPTANIASVRADLINRMIADLDRAVNGG